MATANDGTALSPTATCAAGSKTAMCVAGHRAGVPDLRTALVGGLLTMVVGIVSTLGLSLVVPPPVALELLGPAIGAASFLIGFVWSYETAHGE